MMATAQALLQDQTLPFDPIFHFGKAQAFPLGKTFRGPAQETEPESCWQPGMSASALVKSHHQQQILQ